MAFDPKLQQMKQKLLQEQNLRKRRESEMRKMQEKQEKEKRKAQEKAKKAEQEAKREEAAKKRREYMEEARQDSEKDASVQRTVGIPGAVTTKQQQTVKRVNGLDITDIRVGKAESVLDRLMNKG